MRPNRQDEASPRSWRSFGQPHEHRDVAGRREGRRFDDERCYPRAASESAEDAALIEAIHARNADAIEDVYDRYADRLYCLALLVADDELAARDAVGDALLALWADPVALRAYTRGVHAALAGETYTRATGHRARGVRRRGQRRSRPRSVASDAPDTGSPLTSLPRPQRDLLALIVLGDHTRRQAADRVGVPDDHAAHLISSALRSLRTTHRATGDLAGRPDRLQDALSNRVVIEHAKGIIAQHAGIDPNTALELLHARADMEHGRLSDIARDIVEGHLDVATLVDPRSGAVAQRRSAPRVHDC